MPRNVGLSTAIAIVSFS